MKTHDFRTMSEQELSARIERMQAEYLEAREGVRSGKEANHASLRPLRADLARAKTVLVELTRSAALQKS